MGAPNYPFQSNGNISLLSGKKMRVGEFVTSLFAVPLKIHILPKHFLQTVLSA